jgi:hypothetical protein
MPQRSQRSKGDADYATGTANDRLLISDGSFERAQGYTRQSY